MNNVITLSHNPQRTSVMAAEKAFPKTGSLKRKVYDYFISRGEFGATDQEIESALGLSGNTVRPTRQSLQKDGYILDSGFTRSNANNNQCIVWCVPNVKQGVLF
jgi:transcription initiation factor IIE alpha subunit